MLIGDNFKLYTQKVCRHLLYQLQVVNVPMVKHGIMKQDLVKKIAMMKGWPRYLNVVGNRMLIGIHGMRKPAQLVVNHVIIQNI